MGSNKGEPKKEVKDRVLLIRLFQYLNLEGS